MKRKELFANPITYKRCGKGAKSRAVIEDRKITRYYSDGEPNRHYGEAIGSLHDLTAAAGLFVVVKSGAYGGKDIVWLKGGLTGPKRLPADILTIEHVKEPRP